MSSTSNSKRKALLLVSLVFLLECLDARKTGGSFGGGRGNSGARMNPQQPPPQSGGGFGGHQQAGGFAGQPHYGGGPGMQSNFRPGPAGGGGFHSGSGMGSASRGSSFKSALAGAALGTVGGLLLFEAGKAIIQSHDRPFHYENRDYYWGQEYAKRRPDEHMCSYDFDKLIQDTSASATPPPGGITNATSPDQALAQATFQNGTRPKQIVWSCKNWEQCCGTDCCPAPQQSVSRADGHSGGGAMSTIGKILLILTIGGLLLCCCCGLIAYKFCRSAFDSFMPRGNNNNNNNNAYDAPKYDTPGQHYHNNQPQSYPMQPYPGSAQAAPMYPAAPQAPGQYPAYPPAPGYYEGQKY